MKHKKELFTLPLGKWRIPIALVLIAAAVAILVPTDHVSALGIWKAYFFEPTLLFAVIATVLKTEEDRLKLIVSLGISALLVSRKSLLAIFLRVRLFPKNMPGGSKQINTFS